MQSIYSLLFVVDDIIRKCNISYVWIFLLCIENANETLYEDGCCVMEYVIEHSNHSPSSWLQFPYWCAPSLANRSASSLYWSPLWPDTWMNSICMELVSKSLLNSIKSHLFASGSPLALQNPFRSQRGSHLSTALHKNSESVFMRKYLTRSRMQSLSRELHLEFRLRCLLHDLLPVQQRF